MRYSRKYLKYKNDPKRLLVIIFNHKSVADNVIECVSESVTGIVTGSVIVIAG